MKEYKIKIQSWEHSEAVQKRLFELGYAWRPDDWDPNGKSFQNRGGAFLYADSEGDIEYSGDHRDRDKKSSDFFDSLDRDEITLEDL